ncbi:hypothetical protein VTL71DRAFT_2198 [Oculimacula yallundae]|uniref:OTU domain-containing protein n=1 Tax=Oculimacula yallundae TaxID=86028 RepID=A0ABR4C877_9HELO
MPRFSKFPGEKRINGYGLKTVIMPGDGNCLFRAFSDQMYGHQEEHLIIRAKVVKYMEDHPEDFMAFIPEDAGLRRNEKRGATKNKIDKWMDEDAFRRNLENHLSKMAEPGNFADEAEICAFVKAFGMNVSVYQGREASDRFYEDGGNPVTVPGRILYVALANEHYWSVRNINGPHEGPARTEPNDKEPHHKLRAGPSPSSSATLSAESPTSRVTPPSKTSNSRKRGREDEPEPAPRPAPVKYDHGDMSSWLGAESDSD